MLRRYIAQPRHEDVWAAPPHVTYQLTFGSNKANNDDDNNKNKSDIQNDDSEHKDGDSKL